MVNKAQEKELKDAIGEAYAFLLGLSDSEFEESAKAYLEACSGTPGARIISQAVIDKISERRQIIKENKEFDKIIFMLRETPVNEEDYKLQARLFTRIRGRDASDNWNMYRAFQYGIIQGKRIERKKRHRKDI